MDISIINFVLNIALLLFSVSIHESAHGWMAEKFGDPTARIQGRITLNPIPHIDLVGSIIFPISLYLMRSSTIFGWAKPVIVNPYNLRNPRRANIFISAAGPCSNIITASFAILILFILKHIAYPFLVTSTLGGAVLSILIGLMRINIGLAIFNLIPIPPLDGSGIVEGLLHGEALYNYQKLKPYGFIILVVILFSGILNFILSPIFSFISDILMHILN